MPVRRLEAEAVRDAILAVSGQLNREPFGKPISVAVTEGGIVDVAGGAISKDQRELKTLDLHSSPAQPAGRYA